MSHYLIIGKNFGSLKQKIIDRGDTYTVLQDKDATKFPDKRLKNRVVADFTSQERLLQAVDALPDQYDGVVTIYENYVLPAAWVAEHLGLPGMPAAAAEACTDKYLMRQLFAQAPSKISPGFAEVKSEADVVQFASRHRYPLILKPANLAKSLLVTKSMDEAELISNYRSTMAQIEAIYKRYAPHRTPKLIIEEFMVGSIHSVDAFVDNDGKPHVLDQIVDYQTGYDIGFADNFHYSRLLPSQLSAGEQTRLREVATLGVQALGMRSSPAHIEIIMTNAGPQIVEIGARNGGYRERMHGLANDIDILGATLDLAANKSLNLTAVRSDGCAVLELFPKNPGTFVGLQNKDNLEKLASLQYLNIKAKPGQLVGKAADGHKMCAVIILHHSDYQQFSQDLAYVNDYVSVETNDSK